MKCEFIDCKYKCKYGNFCYKHRNMYLLKDGIISKYRFTYKISDYNIKDIKYTLQRISNTKNTKNTKKDDLFKLLINEFNKDNSKNIVKCQSYIRRYLVQKNKIRGPGYFLKELCKNDEDFYFMTSINELEDKYFFSYKDQINNIWFFDIRSFKQLIRHKSENPYTREKIPENIINNAKDILKNLSMQKINTDIIEILHTNREDIIKQKCVDLFSDISQHGYFCDIKWILSLNLINLKKLYRNLEDIWNYRAYLTNDIKSRIAPPDGKVYNISVREVYDINDSNDIIDLIITETNKFNNAIENSDKTLGYMYFLIGLGEISKECLESNPLIGFALY